MKYILILCSFSLLIIFYAIPGHKSGKAKTPEYLTCYRIMFWNPENLFDTFNDSLTADDEFLPSGIRHWTSERYRKKLVNVYKTVLAAGNGRPPEIVGLCEIENRNVLFDLTRETPFRHFKYEFVHYDSPDIRGIDVALLYDPKSVKIIEDTIFPVVIPGEREVRSRDILYVRAIFRSGDTLSVFINHWPSKYAGAGLTESYRIHAAKMLRNLKENLLNKFPDEQILIMGDFNDPPESNSISVHLGCHKPGENIQDKTLYNLSSNAGSRVYGTYKYQGIWEILDQFIVTGNLLSNDERLKTSMDKFKIFAPQFLLEHDEIYGGEKPFRTYKGMKYQAGFSDHLPVILDMEFSAGRLEQ